jgi:hypothetical protein
VADDVDDLVAKCPRDCEALRSTESARVRPGDRSEGAASAAPPVLRRLWPLPAADNSTSVLAAHGLWWWEDVTPKLTRSFGDHYLSRPT